MSQSRKPLTGLFGLPYPLEMVVGALLMVGGYWVSKNFKPEWLKAVQEIVPLDPGKTIAVVGVFMILYPVVRLFFIDPLAEAIGNRTRELESTFTEAESLRTEMTAMRNDYERRITDTEARAREQIQAQIREAQELRATLMAEATAKADELVRRAQEDIAHEREKALQQLRIDAANLSLLAAEKILRENIDTERNRRLVDEFIRDLEVAKN